MANVHVLGVVPNGTRLDQPLPAGLEIDWQVIDNVSLCALSHHASESAAKAAARKWERN